jgi:hypothetical protein
MASVETATKFYYKEAKTPKITDVSPTFGPSENPPDLVLTGVNFGTVKSELLIVVCGYAVPEAKITALTDSSITIDLPKKSEISASAYTASTLTLSRQAYGSVLNASGKAFTYMALWSDLSTWGGEVPPRDGETVHIPKGQSMMLDTSTSKLNLVNIEGELRFADVSEGITF